MRAVVGDFGSRVFSLASALLAASFALALGPAARAQGYPLGSVSGPAATGQLGFSVSVLGDVNGDGVPDILAGGPLLPGLGGFQPGGARILSGASGASLLTLSGALGDLYFGWSVSAAGDLDADGVTDALVGVPGAAPGGSARVYSSATGAILFTVSGAAGEALGRSVAGAGDLDGDGVPDVVVGAPFASFPGLPFAGRARVFSGASTVPLLTLAGLTAYGELGSSVANAGDVDADGIPDILVGSPFGGTGTATLFSGATGLPVFTFTGVASGDEFGAAVASAGDVNADGVPDLIVGSPGASLYPWFGQGTAVLFSGASGLPLFTLDGGAFPARFGSSVAGAGDVNADGSDDVIVGAYDENVAAGLHAGTAKFFSGASGLRLLTLAGSAGGENFGYSVAGIGDLNGDGFPDVAAGAPQASPAGFPFAGSVRAFSFVGLPPASVPYGTGCSGSGGVTPLLTTSGGPPTASANSSGGGNPNFRVYLGNALGGTTAFLVIGTVPLIPGTDLGPFGSPGCFLHVSPLAILPATTLGTGPGAGRAAVPIPIPGNPALVGDPVYLQWYVADPGPGPAPAALTSAVLFLIV